MEILKSLEGFPLDLRTPGVDVVALKYANDWFGPSRVEKVLGVLHRSEVTSERMISDLMDYDRVYVGSTVKDEAIYQMAYQSVRDQLIPKEKLIPLSLGAVEEHPDFPRDRSPGIPWILKGFRRKADCLKDPGARQVWHNKWNKIGRGHSETLPDVALYFRAQVAKVDENKIRAVWGFPIDVMVEEGRYFYPYIKWMKSVKHNIPIAYQVEMATGGMEYINQLVQSHKHCKFLCGDWSKFDKTVPPWLLRNAFQILMDCFDMSKVQDRNGEIFPVSEVENLRRFRRLVRYFINTPVRVHTGERFRKTGGVPSGSMFTNIIDSIVNMIVMRYLAYSTTGSFPRGEIYLGDDSVCALDDLVDLDNISQLAVEKRAETTMH